MPTEPAESVSLRVFLERLIDERHDLYMSKFEASELAVTKALAEQKEAMATAFSASEKAIVKAEAAQADYNIRSNEFRGQLDDQAKTLMPRIETMALFRGVDDKFSTLDEKLNSQRDTFDKSLDTFSKEIASLRESRSSGTGRDNAQHEFLGQRNQSILMIIAFVGMMVTIIALIWKK
jgi:Mg2+ and Co2+ transporter CorA